MDMYELITTSYHGVAWPESSVCVEFNENIPLFYGLRFIDIIKEADAVGRKPAGVKCSRDFTDGHTYIHEGTWIRDGGAGMFLSGKP